MNAILFTDSELNTVARARNGRTVQITTRPVRLDDIWGRMVPTPKIGGKIYQIVDDFQDETFEFSTKAKAKSFADKMGYAIG